MPPRVSPTVPALLIGLLLIATVAGLPTATTATQSDQYDISIDGSITVPERTVTVEGDDYTVGSLARRFPGDSLVVSVNAPAGQEYDLYLYNRKVQIEQSQPMTGNDTAEFSTDRLAPSTYFVAVYYEGNIQKIHPLVIAGYEMSQTTPNTVTRGNTANISVDVTRTDNRVSDSPRRVQVVIGNETTMVRVNATRKDGQYVAEVPTGSLSPDDYATYSVVRGENETKSGEDVVVGLSDRSTITVEKEPTPTPTPTRSSTPTDSPTPTDSDGSTGGDTGGSDPAGGGSDSSGDNDPTPFPTPTPTATTTPTSTPVPATSTPPPTVTPAPGTPTPDTMSPTPSPSPSPGTPSPTPSPSPTPVQSPAGGSETATVSPSPTVSATPTSSPSPTPSPTDDGVITPNANGSDDSTRTTTGGQSGFGALLALAALSGALLLTRRG